MTEHISNSTLKVPAAMLDAVLNTMGEAIVAIDEQSIIVMVNPAAERIWGYTRAQLIGSDLAMLMPETFRERHQVGLKRYLTTEDAKVLNKRIRLSALHANGHEFPIELYIAPTRVDGRTFFTGAIRDISDQVAAEEQLRAAKDSAEAASKAKSAFVATMSHEIRTPLNAVIGAITLMRDSRLNQTQLEMLGLAEDSAHSLLQTLSTILEFSKIEAGQIEIESTSFDVYQLIASAVSLIEPRAVMKDLDISTFVDPRVPRMLQGDPGLIRQTLLNLLSNAIKFTEQGAVSVAAELGGQRADDQMRLRFTVEDTGVGISPNSIPHLFTEFSQADHSYTRRFGGSGLGLAIVKRLLAAMNGEIEVQSELSKGSRFSFEIPLEVDLSASSQHLSLSQTKERVVAAFISEAHARATMIRQLEHWKLAVHNADMALGPFLVSALNCNSSSQPEVLIIESPDYQKYSVAIQSADWAKFILIVSAKERASYEGVVPQHVRLLSKPVGTIRLYRAMMEQLSASAVLYENPELDFENESPEVEVAPAGARVLLAEDSPSNQYVGKELLSRAGYLVDIANNGVEALELARLFPYDAVLMDLHMPEMDGLDATKAIRALPSEYSRVPIIAMTANVSESDRQQCLATGMDGFIPKPFDKVTLLNTIFGFAQKSAPLRASRSRDQDSDIIDKKTWAKMKSTLGDASLSQGVKLFIAELEQKSEEIIAAFDENDYALMALHAHALKGGANTFGALSLGEVLEELQHCAESELILDIGQCIDKAKPLLKASKIALENLV